MQGMGDIHAIDSFMSLFLLWQLMGSDDQTPLMRQVRVLLLPTSS